MPVKGNFEKQINLLLAEAMVQISEEEIQASWEMLERKIGVWEQQKAKPNHHRDIDYLGDSAGK